MTSTQSLSQLARVQAAANRYALIRRTADAKLIEQIKAAKPS